MNKFKTCVCNFSKISKLLDRRTSHHNLMILLSVCLSVRPIVLPVVVCPKIVHRPFQNGVPEQDPRREEPVAPRLAAFGGSRGRGPNISALGPKAPRACWGASALSISTLTFNTSHLDTSPPSN